LYCRRSSFASFLLRKEEEIVAFASFLLRKEEEIVAFASFFKKRR